MANLFTMQGRISRQQYVVTSLVIVVIGYAIAFAAGFVSGMAGASENATTALGFVIGCGISVVQAFLVVRRLHDIGKPGWHYWLFFVPLYNIYLGLVLLFTQGERGSNSYGPSPA
jgi:uncharacterized membrane protein YhaH (DUF805 family)